MVSPDSITFKRCPSCKRNHPATSEFFSRDKNRSDGWYRICKACNRALRQRDKAKISKQKRDYYERNKTGKIKYSRQYRVTHKADAAEYRREYMQRPRTRELRKLTEQRRRARKHESGGVVSLTDVAMLLKSQKGLCWWCDASLANGYHIDHRIPLARGGTNRLNNLCLACPSCNVRKGAKLPHEWNGRLL